jgi:hypothetical protein
MQGVFDPYQQWLGIPPTEFPPDHYRLLGLPPFTGDRAEISRAAEARIAQVRQADGGRQPQLAERLVKELTQARQALLDPTRKPTYDAILRGARIAQTAAAPATAEKPWNPRPVAFGASPAELPPAVEPQPMPVAAWPGKSHIRARLFLYIGIAVVGVAAIVLGVALSLVSRPRVASRDVLLAPDRAGAKRLPAPSLASTARPAQRENLSPRSAGPQVQPSPEVAALLAAARRAMYDRDLKTADESVDRAIGAARSDGDRTDAQRVSKLLRSLAEFWRAAGDECRRLQTGEELEIGDTRVIVVGVDARGLTIHAAGRNLDYTFGDLPRSLAVVAAERRLSRDPQTMHLDVGSFLAVDRRGDRQEARRRWEQAGPEGQSLMPEIDLAPPVQNVTPGK